MGEKRYQPVVDGAFQHGESGSYVVDTLSEKRNWSDPPGYEMTAGEVCDLINSQSAEIAGLRKEIAELTEIINDHEWKDVRWSDESPNHSKIPNSSEVSR